jgi:hypothetical protein
MQQINHFSLTPMNDPLAERTIEDHKYLLEQVENKCAIAFFAATNRNQSLYNALQRYAICGDEFFNNEENKEKEIQLERVGTRIMKDSQIFDDPLEEIF